MARPGARHGPADRPSDPVQRPGPGEGARPAAPSVAVFDLGGVLIDWNPRYLYRHLFDDPADMERFLDEVGFAEWNHLQDAGRPFAVGLEELAAAHPARRQLLEAFIDRWPESLGGAIPASVDVVRELRDRGVRLLALTNWSAETFPVALDRFEFLDWFDGIVVSGELGVAKPDPAIFEHLLERFGIEARDAVFVDDSAANIEAAAALGFHSVHFEGPASLRAELTTLGLL